MYRICRILYFYIFCFSAGWRKYHGVKFEHGMYHAVLTLPSVVKPTAAAIAAIVEHHSSASVIQKKKELLTTTKTRTMFLILDFFVLTVYLTIVVQL